VKTKQKERKANAAAVLAKKGSAVTAGPRNALDSSAPIVRRGKERERSRKKKKSTIKKIILAERAERRERRMAMAASCEEILLLPAKGGREVPEENCETSILAPAKEAPTLPESHNIAVVSTAQDAPIVDEEQEASADAAKPADEVKAKSDPLEEARKRIHSRKFRE